MNSEEYSQWQHDAKRALESRYTAEEIEVILTWFRSIKGADERELIGNEEVEAMLVFIGARENFNMYNSLMARLFIYAPLILREREQGVASTSRSGIVVFHNRGAGRETRTMLEGSIKLRGPGDIEPLPKELAVEVERHVADGKTSGLTTHPRYPSWSFTQA